MTITNYQSDILDDVTVITVTSDLSSTIYYHWYVDGLYVGWSLSAARSFRTIDAGQSRVTAIDTNDVDFDAIANAPAGWPPTRTLWWCRSTDSDVDHYRIDQQQDGGDWETIARVPQLANQWTHEFTTGRLDDLSAYAWRIYPVDSAGNAGTVWEFAAETIVRTPDAPDFTQSFDSGTTKVTFTAA